MGDIEAVQLRTSLEGELSWRQDEVREIRNWRSHGLGISESDSYKRVLIVLLYAHLEGFVKVALQEYVKAVNDCCLPLEKLHDALAAACLAEEFKQYRKSDPGDPYDPYANQSRQVAKDADLVQRIRALGSKPVTLDADRVVSTDSNLSPAVLRRNLAMLAIRHHDFDAFMKSVTGLLKRRNAIAHGERIKLPDSKGVTELETAVFQVCDSLMKVLYEATRDEEYRQK